MRTGFLVMMLSFAWLVYADESLGNFGFEPAGTVIHVDAASLPEPYASPSHANWASYVLREGRMPQVPEGFEVNIFAEGLDHPRRVIVDEQGGVYLAESGADKITYLRDTDGDGVADIVRRCLDDFDRPYGMAFHGDAFYIADVDYVWRVSADVCRAKTGSSMQKRQKVTPQGGLGDSQGHSTRNIALSADGRFLYVAIGSRGNINDENEPRATIREFDLKNAGRYRTYASGLRNAVGIIQRDDVLWTVVNERDGLGDDLVPDYLTRVEDGGFYGWPYTYLGAYPQPGWFDEMPEGMVVTEPSMLFRAHSAPLGFAFYDDDVFPSRYRGGAFVALHGSWNALVPRGYLVAYVPFRAGVPEGHYEVFMTGFRVDAPQKNLDTEDNQGSLLSGFLDDAFGDVKEASVFGRPADVAVAQDGSLLVADDTAGVIWRIAWRQNN